MKINKLLLYFSIVISILSIYLHSINSINTINEIRRLSNTITSTTNRITNTNTNTNKATTKTKSKNKLKTKSKAKNRTFSFLKNTAATSTKRTRALTSSLSVLSKSENRRRMNTNTSQTDEESYRANVIGSIIFARIAMHEGDIACLLKKVGVIKEENCSFQNEMVYKTVRDWLSYKTKLEVLTEIKNEFDQSLFNGFKSLKDKGEFKYDCKSNTFGFLMKPDNLTDKEAKNVTKQPSPRVEKPTGPFGYYGGRGIFPTQEKPKDNNENNNNANANNNNNTPDVMSVPGGGDLNGSQGGDSGDQGANGGSNDIKGNNNGHPSTIGVAEKKN